MNKAINTNNKKKRVPPEFVKMAVVPSSCTISQYNLIGVTVVENNAV